MARNLLSLQHFLHTPNLLQLPLKTTLHATHSCTCISTPVPEGVLCTVGISMLSSAFSLHPIHTMCTMPIHEVPAHAHQPNSPFPWLVHHYVPTIHLRIYFPAPGHCHACSESPHLDTVAHFITHSLECPLFNTGHRGPSFGRLAHSLGAHHHSPATSSNVLLVHMCPPPFLARSLH